MRKTATTWASIFTLLLILLSFLPFQACGDKVLFQSSHHPELKSGENGEGYSGKPTPYDFADRNRACSDIGANGQPLPNSQIFLYPNGLVQLVRDHCADIPPRALTSAEYSWASDGSITYQNQSYVGNLNPDPFAVVAAACPAGRTLLANPVRTSLVPESLNLQAEVWEHPGLAVSLQGSLASLPVYNVQRNDPTQLESWHRMAQSPLLQAGEDYVFSFYIKPEPGQKAQFVSYFPNAQDFRVEFDLASGAATVQSVTGVTLQATKAQMFAGGWYMNIYFKSLNDVQPNIGVGPSGEFMGSAIATTALQLEKVSSFCSP